MNAGRGASGQEGREEEQVYMSTGTGHQAFQAFQAPQLVISLESVSSPRRGHRAQPTLSMHFPDEVMHGNGADTAFPPFMEILPRRDSESRPIRRSQSLAGTAGDFAAASAATSAAQEPVVGAVGKNGRLEARRHSYDYLPDARRLNELGEAGG
eukprot:CAMPEP_0180702872 /NCGR_PEP_ID=MMETSP1038_2-20121128/6341_1 /TAXON_ID=632150 /ORGANISM="Azadinium spinosum, Strain 3D9" /LENGTH=153 /DNA_ID=CAMNT_0022734641 /DNA_START=30 /DNA_END=487 /DNA_ORIENTATION=+